MDLQAKTIPLTEWAKQHPQEAELCLTMQKNIDDLNAGRIDFAEFQRRNYMRQKLSFLPKLLEHRQAGRWNEFVSMALSIYEVMPEAFEFYDDVPDDLKYSFAIEAYQHHGDKIPAVRKAVRQAHKYGKPDLPADLAAVDTITVYRAGEEPITKAKYRISWTTSIETARFFLETYIGRHATHLYRGKIRPADVIAYTNDRNENEIMQYRKVFDIEELAPTE